MDKYELFNSYFEDTLTPAVSEIPPDYIVKSVNPSKKSLNRIFTGLALSTVTVNLWCLNYILPFFGFILSVIGLRSLRKESRWFFGCYVLTVIRALRFFAILTVEPTVYGSVLDDISFLLSCFEICTIFIYLFLLRKAIGTLQQKAGLIPDTKRVTVLILWYFIICVLGLMEYSGTILALCWIIGYAFIIRSLYKLSKETEETGYVAEAAPVKISDRALACIIACTVAVTCFGANLLFGKYEMKWETKDTAEHTEVQEIKELLISLGFPSHILEDLTAEEIKECEGATEVFTEITDKPVNKGRQVTKTYSYSSGNVYQYTDTVYDVKELRITGIAVKLPGEPDTWKLIHHFEWTVNPGFYGTEAIKLWTMDGRYKDWRDKTTATGRLLYDRDGITYSAPYYSLGKETYTSEFNALTGGGSSRDTFAAFSLPDKGERQRGYLTYQIEEVDKYSIVSSYINYTHQLFPFTFPVRTALENTMSGRWGDWDFRTVQEALQFDTYNGKAEPLS